MFENDINDLLAILKEQFKPLFEHVYFRHSYELNGIDDSKPYQIYLSFQNDKDTIIVDQGKQNNPSVFQVRMKAIFQFTPSINFDQTLQKAIFSISNFKNRGVSCVISTVLADSSEIVKLETNVKLKKEIPLILVNFVLRKNMLVASCDQLCENDCK